MDELNEKILEGLAVTIALCGTAWSEQATRAACLKLQRKYPVGSVLAALDRCQDECKGRLALGDIVERIEEANTGGWPGPNEAWAAMGDRGEGDTLVCVQEALTAQESVQTLADSDLVAARMAFLESYKRLVARAKAEGRQPEWRVSLGHDPAGRQRALLQAVERGWLPRAEAERHLGEPLGPKALPGAGLKMLTGKVANDQVPAMRSQDTAAKLSELLGTFVNPELARQALEDRRRESQKVYRVVNGRPQEVPGVVVPLAEVVQSEPGYRPPNREEVAEIRRKQGQGS